MKLLALRRNLFIKIFLWFWLGFLLINLVFLLVSLATQTEIAPTRSRAMTVKIEAFAAAQIFESGGVSALKNYFEKTENETEIRAFLIDEKGFDLTGKPFPEEIKKILPNASEINKVESESIKFTTFSAVKIVSENDRTYIFANEMPRFAFLPMMAAKPFIRFWRFPLTLFISGLICFLLARYLTKPIIELSRATRQFADGNLNVRVSEQFAKRRDEFADLSRDFDSMAVQIESNIESQKRLLSDISHELRSPLTRLNIALSLARESINDRKELQESHDIIELEAGRIDRLIEQLLTLTKFENLKEKADFTDVNLSELLEIIASDAEFEAKAKNRDVKLFENPEIIVKGNRRLLQSAVENIVRNAIRHTAENTAVEINLKKTEENALISVKDYGLGIPENELSRIFRPFYRVEKARERETGGTGLGLSIAERAVTLHRGKISASNSENGGLIITIILPLDV